MTAIETRDMRGTPGELGTLDDAHEHDPHLGHHWDSAPQQYEAAKFGMWLFLATELLFFGGLFCVYAVFRHTRPEIFSYGSRFLDVNFGAINTAVLITSSVTMAWAVRAAQLNQRKTLLGCLAATILGGGIFMVIKYFEYSHKIHENLVWGMTFYEDPHGHEAALPHLGEEASEGESAVAAIDVAHGKELWMTTCRACHGVAGEGITGQGKDIRGSEFIAGKDDAELVAFVKIGRMPFDPLNTTGIQMPPKGGNPLLNDDDLRDIVGYVRTFKAPEGAAVDPGAAADAGVDGEVAVAEEAFWIPGSSIPVASAGPGGVNQTALVAIESHRPAVGGHDDLEPEVHHTRDPERPANAHVFFTVYFSMTGLHGIHVLVGMAVISWLFVRALLGHFGSSYYTPVDLVGLYWHVVDLIWIFLFPLFYLIH